MSDNKFEESVETHESYVLAHISRVSGRKNLFGSVVEPDHYFKLEILPARKVVSWTGETEYKPASRAYPLIEINLSASQFAELITTLNIGEGVPATLNYLDGKKIPDSPAQKNHISTAIEVGNAKVKAVEEKWVSNINEAIALLANKTLSKENRKQIQTALEDCVYRVRDSGSFYQNRIVETGSKVIAQIKTEIDAFTTMTVHKVGLATLQNPTKSAQEIIHDVSKEVASLPPADTQKEEGHYNYGWGYELKNESESES